ncbi:MAG TPA: alpha/beta hydrolase [Actinomycetes bacterium]|nr:alpha/beta hydrolase [Actinomycetes bacterium]
MSVPVTLATRTWSGGRDRQVDPLALLIHGVTSSSRTWWRVAPELVRRGFRVLAVDLRGHGASPPVSEGVVLGDLSADVLETLRASGLSGNDGPRPAAPPGTGAAIDLLVGHSLGALVALDLVAKEPGLARRLVLEEPAGPTGVDWEAMAEGIRSDGRRARAEPEAMRRELAVSDPAWDPAEVDRRLADMADCDAKGIAAAFRRTIAFDLAGLASAVHIPTLLLAGLEHLGSALVGPDRVALVEALDGRGDFEVLDDGHNLHREAFPRFMDVLDGWLRVSASVREG